MTVEADGREGTTGPAVDCSAVDHPTAFGGFGVVTVVGPGPRCRRRRPTPVGRRRGRRPDRLRLRRRALPGHHPLADLRDADGRRHHDHRPRPPRISRSAPTCTPSPSRPTSPPATRPPDRCPASCVDQFALSEHDGDLRVATTTDPDVGGPAHADERARRHRDAEPAHCRDHSLRSARAASPCSAATAPPSRPSARSPASARPSRSGASASPDPTAYVVTFRQTDPLFVVDLSDPTAPHVAGELKIPGFSSYLAGHRRRAGARHRPGRHHRRTSDRIPGEPVRRLRSVEPRAARPAGRSPGPVAGRERPPRPAVVGARPACSPCPSPTGPCRRVASPTVPASSSPASPRPGSSRSAP